MRATITSTQRERLQRHVAGRLARADADLLGAAPLGTTALIESRPVKVLGAAIYNMPGLCFQGPLDQFWCNAAPPDAELRDGFVRAIAATIQIKGGFFSEAALQAAVAAAADRIESRRLNQPDAYVDFPPRLIPAAGEPIARL